MEKNTNKSDGAENTARSLQIGLAVVGVLIAGFLVTTILREDTIANGNGSSSEVSGDVQVPSFLQASFRSTDFSKASETVSLIQNGGPGKDGIPAISDPVFIPIEESEILDDVQAIVLEDATGQRRAYPYNILTWHEIVNDEIDGKPVAVTFCPLCGSAIVFNRETDAGVAEFGVSGGLFESNMVMYDRLTETLWQQSTGEALAGDLFGSTLELEPFQLLTVGELRENHPDTIIMSTDDTGHSRNYDATPYSGYDESDQFFFAPSIADQTFPLKEIFAVTTVGDISLALQWLELEDGVQYTVPAGDQEVTVEKRDGELFIITADGEELPFYFEMWFSWAVQHQDEDKRAIFSPIQGEQA